ncbi:MAG: carbohydrate ABC transporter permease [Erysipelotrichaceae bacterium]|nr:carbohydrate ABC transporter permease [Erysipelotrichaceae bacterium]
MKRQEYIKNIVLYSLLTIGGIFMIFPFFWMIVTSLKTAAESNHVPPTIFPAEPIIENYFKALDIAPFGTYFMNSVMVTVCCVAITMFTTILAAYAFSKLKFPGRDKLFFLLLSMMMIPFEMLIITNYTTIVDWGLYDNLLALIIPFTSSIFYTYILRNFFMSIPDSLYYSAKVDGASDWQFLWEVMVPMAKTSLVTIGLLNAITCWNSFLWSILVIKSQGNRTLPFGLFAFTNEAGIHYELLMAGATIVVIPMIILFLFCRKSIVTGVSRGGLKG